MLTRMRRQYTFRVPTKATRPPEGALAGPIETGTATPFAASGRLVQPDLRAFLDALERHDKLVRLPRPVHPHTELAALVIEAERRGQAILFEAVHGSAMRVVANVVGDRRMLALGLGVEPGETVPAFLDRSRRRIPPALVPDAPVQEVVATGDAVDVRRLPLVVLSEKDAAPYSTAGLVIAKDPDTGIRNVSFNRMMLRSRDEFGIRMMAPQHLGQIYDRGAARGTAVAGRGRARQPPGRADRRRDDHRLRRRRARARRRAARASRLELVRGVTVDVEVPARAEIVLEGEVLAGVARAGGAVRRLHAVLRPGHAEPRAARDRHHASA